MFFIQIHQMMLSRHVFTRNILDEIIRGVKFARNQRYLDGALKAVAFGCTVGGVHPCADFPIETALHPSVQSSGMYSCEAIVLNCNCAVYNDIFHTFIFRFRVDVIRLVL